MRYSDGVIVFQLPTAVGNWWGNAIILHFGQQISFFFLWMINFCLLQQTEALCDRSLQGLNEILEDWVRSLRVSRLKEKSILFARVRQKKKKCPTADRSICIIHARAVGIKEGFYPTSVKEPLRWLKEPFHGKFLLSLQPLHPILLFFSSSLHLPDAI